MDETELAGGASIDFVTGEALDRHRRLFSHRQGSGIERVATMRFRYGEGPGGVLMILESPFLRIDPSVLRLIAAATSEPVGRLLHDARDSVLRNSRRATVFTGDQLMRRIRDASRDARIIRLDTAQLSDRLRLASPEMDRYRLRQDVSRVLAGMVSDLGDLAEVREDQYVLVVYDARSPESDLLAEQLNGGISVAFGGEPAGGAISFSEHRYSPRSSTALATILGLERAP